MNKRWLKAITILLTVALLAACAPKATLAPETEVPAAEPAEAEAPMLYGVTTPTETLRVAWVGPIQGIYWDIAIAGMKKAAEEIGNIDFSFTAPADLSGFPGDFVKYLDTTIASDIDGLMTMGAAADATKASIDGAVDSGIPVVLIDTDAPGTKRYAYIGTDNFTAGKTGGQYIADVTGGKANVALMTQALTAENLSGRLDGAKEAFASYPDIKIITTEQAASIAESTAKAQAILLAYPEVDTFFCSEGNNELGVSQALIENDLVGKIRVVGVDSVEEILDLIRKGLLDATVSQEPYEMGYLGMYRIVSILQGNVVPSDEVINYTSAVVITKDNVDAYAADAAEKMK